MAKKAMAIQLCSAFAYETKPEQFPQQNKEKLVTSA